jgi:hypothetical protein
MTLPHLPRKMAKIRPKPRSRFQIVGILDHVKTPVIACFQSIEFENYRTDVNKDNIHPMDFNVMKLLKTTILSLLLAAPLAVLPNQPQRRYSTSAKPIRNSASSRACSQEH